MTTFLITGATGNLGGTALRLLRHHDPSAPVRALVRTPDAARRLRDRGVDARVGDYDDPASLDAACAGVDRLLLVSSPVLDPERRAAQHRTAIPLSRELWARPPREPSSRPQPAHPW